MVFRLVNVAVPFVCAHDKKVVTKTGIHKRIHKYIRQIPTCRIHDRETRCFKMSFVNILGAFWLIHGELFGKVDEMR